MKVTPRKEKKAKFRLSFVLLFIIASMLCCFTFYMEENKPLSYYEADNVTEIAAETDISSETSVHTAVTDSRINPVAETERKSSEYFESCLFIGGELPGQMFLSGMIRKESFFEAVPGNGDTAIPEISERTEAVYIFAEYDTQNAELYKEHYKKLSEKSAEKYDADIYIISAPPLIEADNGTDSFNSELLELANSLGVYYVDINTRLKGIDGSLASVYYDDSGKYTEMALIDVSEYMLTHTAE
ncbi:MAG: hypothetical protein IJ446_09530 [Oscillospiraceae bacterium]|nr:hypothetical protein [Oscillospiraceae bacterium]